jgi:hypothetical protein
MCRLLGSSPHARPWERLVAIQLFGRPAAITVIQTFMTIGRVYRFEIYFGLFDLTQSL